MSFFSPYVRVAFRNVFRNKRRSALTVGTMAFGLFCLIVFSGLKVGLHRSMADGTILLDTGALQVHAAGYEKGVAALKAIFDPARAEAELRAAGVGATARRIGAPALLLSSSGSSAVFVTGIEPDAERSVTRISEKVVRGGYVADDGKALIGEELSAILGVDIGGAIVLLAQAPTGIPSIKRFIVGGIYRTELPSFDRTRIFVPLQVAQAFLGAEGMVTEIAAAMVRDGETGAASLVRDALPPSIYQVKTWRELAPDLAQLIEMNEATMRFLILIVFSIVALGIANTMTMTVFERFRELGFLVAMGASRRGILAMIAMESLFLGCFASILGGVAGIVACSWLSRYGIDMSHFTSSNQYFAMTHVIKAYLLPADLFVSIAVALVTSFAAALYPAWKAASLRPVEAIAHI